MSIDDSRRRFLQTSGLGIGWLAALDLFHRSASAAPANPLAPKTPPLRATAKSVISLFMQGGPSQMDTFDPKPLLAKLHGQHPPASFGDEDFQNGKLAKLMILGSKRTFKRHGQSGLEVSDLFPEVAQRADDLAVIRSCFHEGFTHSQAQFLINNGHTRIGRPSLGSWILYGLGSENENLPGFVVLLEGGVRSGPAVYGQGFLPAAYQGTSFRPGRSPILNLSRPAGMEAAEQRDLLDTLRTLNERHLDSRNRDSELEARMESYELAFRMQMAAPEATDVSSEPEATKRLYGLDNPVSADFGGRCLLARRLVERGVRFVQVWSGNGMNATDWDGHIGCDRNHQDRAAQTDKAVGGLLADLKSRGLLDSTLVIWGGEFGRTPTSDGGPSGAEGRDHNPYGFTIWMAGGGVKGGKAIGSTDELGLRAVGDSVHLNDLHATILGLLGLDHIKLTYPYLGRNFRLTDVGGKTDLLEKLRQA
ncbi:MAG TPA: DUF1501 domain-containing protein [Bryobacteraceae bacterium]|nr:DUF1501 domain-containing protein [Bryobacteraceae bacterium]